MKIRGVNLGGWLMMEGYILHGRNIAEHTFKAKFKKIYGKKALREFEDLYRDTFITEEDFKNIAGLGATAIRLPFNHRIVAETPSIFKRDGFE
jgi:aryl-phospho-beta-D-glucosidase BglC (GH1 family)